MARRFPPPWSVEDIGGCFAVKASNGRPLIFIYYGEGVGRRSLARLSTRNAAQRIASGHRQAAGVAASKVIRGPVPMSAFGGKADINRAFPNVCF
jgi:hypothetical protein